MSDQSMFFFFSNITLILPEKPMLFHSQSILSVLSVVNPAPQIQGQVCDINCQSAYANTQANSYWLWGSHMTQPSPMRTSSKLLEEP